MKPKISVISLTIRKGGLDLLLRCLKQQLFTDFEWVIVSNRFDFWTEKSVKLDFPVTIIHDPPKKEGDFYTMNSSWNEAFRNAQGELLVNIVDLLWISPDTLERLWGHYLANPKAVISAIGHQYKELVNGKPEGLVWSDPRARLDQGTFYQVAPPEIELCVGSIPKQAVFSVGGIDEEFDKYAALAEKEMIARIEKVGYKLYLDQSIQYRALYHPRLSLDWDEKYKAGIPYYQECLRQIIEGTRLKLNYL